MNQLTELAKEEKLRLLRPISESPSFRGDETSILQSHLDDPDAEIRTMALKGLWHYPEPKFIPPLFAAAERDPDEGVRCQAIRTLGRYIYEGKGLLLVIIVLALALACGPATPPAQQEHKTTELQAVPLAAGEKLQVVATTNIVSDVVRNVGGDRIELTVLMDVGVDPHSYVPTPADTAALHDAHLVLANGAGLEANLEQVLENAGGEAVQIRVSDGIDLLALPEGTEADPHVWFDVKNVIHWVESIEEALSTLDPTNAEAYAENARAYTRELEELDTWVQEQIAHIPKANRKLVTNHPSFGYFAARYGLEQVGAVYPVSPSGEPSAQDIAALEDAIRHFGAPAVFAESTVNPKLAEQVAEDTGVEVVALYSGSLGKAGSGAESYILLIRYDVMAIVEALR